VALAVSDRELSDRAASLPPATDRLRILLTEGSSLSARHTLYALGRSHVVDVLDPDPWCQCRFSSLSRRWIRSPSFSKQPAEFLRFLVDLLRGGSYDVVLPTHEQVYLLSRFRDALVPFAGLCLPEFSALERLQNKAEFTRLLDELRLPQPETTVIRTREEFDQPWRFPLYVKLAHSTAGRGVFFAQTRDELQARADKLVRAGVVNGQGEILIQQPGRGVQSTAQAVFHRGTLVGSHAFEARRVGVGGMSDARVSADHPLVREQVAFLGACLGWHGSLFLDYFYDRDARRPEYIEANPRIGETVNALLSGVNLPELLVQVSCGDSPPPVSLGRLGVRTHSSMMILMHVAQRGGGRRAVLSELFRLTTGRGIYENSEDELTRPRDDRLSRWARLWIVAQLLAWPALAQRIVAKTVENYALPESATAAIKALPLNLLDGAD